MKYILVVLFLMPNVVFSQNTTGANNAGKAFADALNNSTIKGTASNLDPTTIPGYQGANPPEVQYRNSGSNIENQARQESATDATAQFIFGARNSRPVIVIDKSNDPMFKRMDEVRDLSNGLTENGYQGCITLPVGTEDVDVLTNDTCNATRGITDESCSNTLTVDVTVLETCKPGQVISTKRAQSYHWRERRDYIDIQSICSGNPNTARFRFVKPDKYDSYTCGLPDTYGRNNTPALGLRDDITFNLPMRNSGRINDVNYLNVHWRRRGSKGAYWCTKIHLDLINTTCNTAACSFTFYGLGWTFGTRASYSLAHGFSNIAIGATKYKRVVQSVTDTWDDKCKELDDRL
ncbi:MAG: hypothetical protein QM500_04565 [Methylococcales bacterium]